MREAVGALIRAVETARAGSKVVGTDDTPVKVLDRKLPKARKGRIWPYVGDRDHPAVVYDYTATRERAGPDAFLKSYRGYLQADAHVAYDSFFLQPERGMVEVGCWPMHAGICFKLWKMIRRGCGRSCSCLRNCTG